MKFELLQYVVGIIAPIGIFCLIALPLSDNLLSKYLNIENKVLNIVTSIIISVIVGLGITLFTL